MQNIQRIVYIIPFIIVVILALQPCSQPSTQQQLLYQPSIQCFKKYYDSSKYNNHILSKMIKERQSFRRKLLQQLKVNDMDYTKGQPVIKWAQSNTSIFINFKLSHRHDSPPCSDVRSQSFYIVDIIGDVEATVQFQRQSTEIFTLFQKLIHMKNQTFVNQAQPTNQSNSNATSNITWPKLSSILYYQGQCFLSRQKFKFHLNLTFESLVQKIIIRKEGLGSYTIIAEKQKSQLWKTPFINQHKLAIWRQMRQKYKDDMDAYFEIIENYKQQLKPKKKKKSKRKNNNQQLNKLQHDINQNNVNHEL